MLNDENTFEKSIKALNAETIAIKELGGGEEKINAALARHVLHEDLGHYDIPRATYNLNDKTRDILLAHARQDAAHAVINSSKLV